MEFIIEDNSYKKKILEMTNEEYDAEVDRILNKRKIKSRDDVLMLTSILKNNALTRWDKLYELLDGFFEAPPSEDSEIFIGELFLWKMVALYLESGNMNSDDVKKAIDFAYKLSSKGSFYAHCFILGIIKKERECCCIEDYREYYSENEFLTRAFSGDNPPETLGLMAFEVFNKICGGRKIKAFKYLESVIYGSKYIENIICDIEALEFDKEFFVEGDFGEKEYILAEYYYYAKSDYERSIEYAKASSEKGNSGAYVVWALSLYSELCKGIEADSEKDKDYICEKIVNIIELMRLSLDSLVKGRGLFFKDIGGIEFLEKNIPLVLKEASSPDLAKKLCEMASKGSPFEQYLVFYRKKMADPNYELISYKQAFEWAVNAIEYGGMGDGKIQLNCRAIKSELAKEINKARVVELLSY